MLALSRVRTGWLASRGPWGWLPDPRLTPTGGAPRSQRRCRAGLAPATRSLRWRERSASGAANEGLGQIGPGGEMEVQVAGQQRCGGEAALPPAEAGLQA